MQNGRNVPLEGILWLLFLVITKLFINFAHENFNLV